MMDLDRDESTAGSHAGPDGADRRRRLVGRDPLGIATGDGPSFLPARSEMAGLIRSRDWTQSPLGPPEQWPSELRRTLALCLASSFPLCLAWGEDRVQLYNDGYAALCGPKHPEAFGQDFRECWDSAWPVIGAAFEGALQGETTMFTNTQMFLDRHGYREETFFTSSFSPIPGQDGRVVGVFHPVTETTQAVLSDRRMTAIRDVADHCRGAESSDAALRLLVDALSRHPGDIPFAMGFAAGRTPTECALVADAGLPVDDLLTGRDDPSGFHFAGHSVAQLRASGQQIEVIHIDPQPSATHRAASPSIARHAIAIPLHVGLPGPAPAILILGASPYRALDATYLDFFRRLAELAGGAVQRAYATTRDRQRVLSLTAVDRARTRFFSEINKGLRTALAQVVNPIERVLEDADDPLQPQHRRQIRRAYRNAGRVRALTDRLLQLPGTETEESSGEPEPVGSGGPAAGPTPRQSSTARRNRVLFVDADPIHRERMIELLETRFDVESVNDGATALNLARSDPPGMILCDLSAPEMDGPRLISELRANQATSEIPVVLFAAQPGETARDDALASGADDFLAEPLLGQDLLPRLSRTLSRIEFWRHASEAALVQSEEQFRLMVESVQEYAIYMLDHEGYIVTWNAGAARITGYTESEILGKHLRVLHGSSELEGSCADEILRRAAQDGQCLEEGWRHRRDGRPYWSKDTVTRLKDEGGRPRGFVHVTRDSTEQKRAEARFIRAVESAPNGMVLVDSSGTIVMVNLQTEQTFGYARGELIGQPVGVLLPERVRAEHARHRAGFMEQPQVRAMGAGRDLAARRKDGSEFPVEIGLNPIEMEDGTFVLCAVVDITERKKVEAAAKETHLELERRVVERTADLEAANRELEAFSYSVSHDLRAPLRAIDGFSRIVLDDYAAGMAVEACDYLRDIRENTQHMGRLVDDLLAFSRLGRQPVRRREVDTNRLVRDCVTELLGVGECPHIDMRLNHLPNCWGDRALLKQVWLNLLSNAVKYTRRRGVAVIEVFAEETQDDPCFVIRDNGVGFDMRYADKLFGVFQRLHRAEEYEGTGVGLAIVQRIVHRHGGQVWAESEPDRGATLRFTLPVREATP